MEEAYIEGKLDEVEDDPLEVAVQKAMRTFLEKLQTYDQILARHKQKFGAFIPLLEVLEGVQMNSKEIQKLMNFISENGGEAKIYQYIEGKYCVGFRPRSH